MTKRLYELRPWGRPMGIIAAVFTIALFSPFLMMPVQVYDAYQSGDFGSFIFEATLRAFFRSLIWSSLGIALVWWWLAFMGWRSPIAFAIAGIVNLTVWVGLNGVAGVIYSRIDAELAGFVAFVIALYGLVGVLSHLALHFVAYRKVRVRP